MNFEKGQLNNIEKEQLQPWQEKIRAKVNIENLPVYKKKEEIVNWLETCLNEKNIALLQGETGSGKSILTFEILDEVLNKVGKKGNILSIQPRKDAAMGVSRAASAVSGYTWGEKGKIGCSTSEAKEASYNTQMRVVTTGIAVRYLADMYKNFVKYGDSYLPNFNAIIVDEFHENSIDYHLILGILKKIKDEYERCPFILLTSATLDKQGTLEYFSMDDSEFKLVEGRAYPVDISYKKELEPGEKRKKLEEEAAESVKEMLGEIDGDILVFLPGVKQINATIEALGDIENVEIISLHGGLEPEEREYALTSEPRDGFRRIVVATNIAESSLTLPRIKGVVDSCRYNCYKYNSSSGINEKSIELISKDSATQRAGRAGRLQEGKCNRLVTEEEWLQMPEHVIPEIKQKNLSNVVLKIKGLGMEAQDFPFREQPEKDAIEAAENELKILGALDNEGNLTKIGSQMLEMPFFSPPLSRTIIEAKEVGCVEAALVLATLEREAGGGNKSAIFYQPSYREFDERAEKLLFLQGYEIKSWKPLTVFFGGIKMDASIVSPLISKFKNEAKFQIRAEYELKQNQFGTSGSDWERNLKVFIQAWDRGVFELATKERTPAWEAANLSFRKWARENKVNADALKHAAKNIYEYSNLLHIPIDRNQLRNELLQADWNKIGLVLLAGHPHKLLFKSSTYGMAEYSKFIGDDDYFEINLSPQSASFNKTPDCCIATALEEGPGTRSGYKISRNYASGIHPISIEQILEVHPHLIEKTSGSIVLEGNKVFREENYSPTGAHVVISRELIPATREESIDFFANESADPYRQFNYQVPVLEQNAKTIREILRYSSVYGFQIKDVTKWYKEKYAQIDGVLDINKILANQALLELKRGDLTSYEFDQFIEDQKRVEQERQLRYQKMLEENSRYSTLLHNPFSQASRINSTVGVEKSGERFFSGVRINEEPQVKKEIPKTDLPLDLYEKIEALDDLEDKWEAIGYSRQEREQELINLKEKVSQIEKSEKEADDLSTELVALRKAIQKKESSRKELTNRKGDKEREVDLKREIYLQKQNLREQEEKLNELRKQKRELIDIRKREEQLQKEIEELVRMEADVIEKMG